MIGSTAREAKKCHPGSRSEVSPKIPVAQVLILPPRPALEACDEEGKQAHFVCEREERSIGDTSRAQHAVALDLLVIRRRRGEGSTFVPTASSRSSKLWRAAPFRSSPVRGLP